jgi:hypothetical protein
MSFGKNPALLSEIGNFHQQAAAFQNRGERKTTRGGLRFQNQYRPSENFVDLIRLVPVGYDIEYANEHGQLQQVQLGFYTYTEHFDGRTKKSSVCSAGPFANFREKREPCIGCDMFWAEARNKQRRMSKRDMYVFNVFDYDTYYEIEQVDKRNGQVRTKDDGTPWMEWVKGVGRNDLAKSGKKSKEGHLCHWAMGHGHYTTLLSTNEMIGEGCKSCGHKRSPDERNPAIQSLAWLCSNQECGEALIDLSETEMNGDDIKKTVKKPMLCRKCKHQGIPNEYIECSHCSSPVRASIYDVDLQVRRVKTSKNEDGNQTQLMITGWSDPRPIDPKFGKVIEKPYDLPAMYAPTPIALQKEWFGEMEQQQPGMRPYGAGGGTGGNTGGNRYGG